jgi:tetratricopeptide (TPR) repeat protein
MFYDQAILIQWLKEWDGRDARATLCPITKIASMNAGNFDKAISDYNEAIRLDPNDFAVHWHRGIAYYHHADYEKAISDFTELIRLDPNRACGYYFRGTVYDKRGDFDRAINNYNNAIRVEPNYAAAYWGRGFSYLHTNSAKAEADFAAAKRLEAGQ